MSEPTIDIAHRKAWMSLLSKAPADRLADLWTASGQFPDHQFLRAPEVGAVMVRGRAGAKGAAFNLGEMTVTRCSVRLASGADGHAYVQGRDKQKATQAALVDALMQTEQAGTIKTTILTKLETEMQSRKATRAAKAAATKVDFFTMVRGED